MSGFGGWDAVVFAVLVIVVVGVLRCPMDARTWPVLLFKGFFVALSMLLFLLSMMAFTPALLLSLPLLLMALLLFLRRATTTAIVIVYWCVAAWAVHPGSLDVIGGLSPHWWIWWSLLLALAGVVLMSVRFLQGRSRRADS
jgi:hypothetical protein